MVKPTQNQVMHFIFRWGAVAYLLHSVVFILTGWTPLPFPDKHSIEGALRAALLVMLHVPAIAYLVETRDHWR
jgi:hypothetical protein